MEQQPPDHSPSSAYIHRESVRLLYQHAWLMSLLVGLTATSFTAYMFRGQVPAITLLSWYALINLIILTRIGLIIAFNRSPPGEAALPAWGHGYQLLVWLNGLAWGLPALYLLDQPASLIFFYSMVISGFVAGAIPGLAFNIQAFYGFALFAVTPLIVQLWRMGAPEFQTLSVLALLFLLINTASAKISHNRILHQIRLEYDNRQLVASLRQEKTRAERANAAKSRFLAAASHDLRQPLHALGLFVDALDQRIRYPEVRTILDHIQLSTRALKRLLNSLLDISKLDAGVLKPELTRFPIQRVFDQLQLELAPLARDKGLGLTIRPSPHWVHSDDALLTRMLRNLINNALHYTDRGGVLVGCRNRGRRLRVEVYDTGPGIDPDEVAHIYDEFYQINNPHRDRRHGLGLGLAIVKGLAGLLDHPLELRSRRQAGSRFTVTLTKADAEPLPASRETDYLADIAGHRVLIIDDDPDILEGMTELLKSWDCDAVTADSAEQALERLGDRTRPPDLLIADYRLRDGGNGLDAIQTLTRALERPPPALIITGDTAPERLREAEASGHYLLHKPVSAARLRSVMSFLFSRATENRPTDPADPVAGR